MAMTDSHALQEKLLFEGPCWQQEPDHIKAVLTKGKIGADDPRVKAVGL
jgi:hypothetical protein